MNDLFICSVFILRVLRLVWLATCLKYFYMAPLDKVAIRKKVKATPFAKKHDPITKWATRIALLLLFIATCTFLDTIKVSARTRSFTSIPQLNIGDFRKGGMCS